MPFSTNNIQPDFGTPLSYLYVGPPQANTGFTPIVASVDTRTIYLASAADGGNDANDGLTDTTPKASFIAARSLVRTGFPDHIRAKCGSNFYYPDIAGESRLYISAEGRSSAEPIVIWWYGDESLGRPIFDGYTVQSGSGATFQNARYSGLEIKNTQKDPDHANFKLELTVDEVRVGSSAYISIVGTDDVEVYASRTVLAGDTTDSIMSDLRTQLLAVVGCAFTTVANGRMIVSKTLAGRFYVRQVSSNSNRLPTIENMIKVRLVGGQMSLLGIHDNLMFDDCVFDEFEGSVQGNVNTGGVLTKNLTWHRMINRGAWLPCSDTYHGSARSANYYIAGIDGLTFSECVADYGGWHKDYPRACANLFSHNYYLANTNTDNLDFSRNITARAASHGAQLRGGGVISDSFMGRCSLGGLLGWQGEPLQAGEVTRFSNTIVSEGQVMAKGNYLFPFDDPYYGLSLTFCSAAIWGFHFEDAELTDSSLVSCLASKQAPLSIQVHREEYIEKVSLGLNEQTLILDRSSPVITDFKSYHYETPTEGDDQNYNDPERTLGDYFDFLGGAALGAELVASGYLDQFIAGDDSFDSFMYIVKHRNLRKWDSRLTAEAINAYIKGGYN